jgi:hypothetical protein
LTGQKIIADKTVRHRDVTVDSAADGATVRISVFQDVIEGKDISSLLQLSPEQALRLADLLANITD